MAKRGRKRGRPQHGHIACWAVSIDRLPESMNGNELATHLHVKRQAIYYWMKLENPIPHLNDGGVLRFERQPVIDWLIATKRYKPKL